MSIPYTYLLGWSKLNKFYYGCRYAKNCRPSDLLNPYMTSSIKVKKFIQENGLPDIVQVRKTFTTELNCRNWENKVLKRMKVVHKDLWLNNTDNKAISRESELLGSHNSRRGKEVFYNNGVENRLFLYDHNPSGWFRGKLPKISGRRGSGTKGLKWYHNPSDPKEKLSCIPGTQPLHFIEGKGKSNRTKCFWYNNGVVEGQFELNKGPQDWKRGRLKKA